MLEKIPTDPLNLGKTEPANPVPDAAPKTFPGPGPRKPVSRMTNERFTMLLFAILFFIGTFSETGIGEQVSLCIAMFFFGIAMLMKFFENHFK